MILALVFSIEGGIPTSLKKKGGQLINSSVLPIKRKIAQNALAEFHSAAIIDNANIDPTVKFRATACKGYGASDWLRALPRKETLLLDAQCCIAVCTLLRSSSQGDWSVHHMRLGWTLPLGSCSAGSSAITSSTTLRGLRQRASQTCWGVMTLSRASSTTSTPRSGVRGR